MDWQTVHWDNNIDGTIYFTVDADGNRTFVTRDELVPVESIEIKPKEDPDSEEVEIAVGATKKDGMVKVTLSTPGTRAGSVMAEIMVKVGAGSGVEVVENGAEAVSVAARDGVITLNNVPADSQVNVYSVAGVHVASLVGTGTVEVNVASSGIYVVSVGDKRFKVRL